MPAKQIYYFYDLSIFLKHICANSTTLFIRKKGAFALFVEVGSE